VAFLIEIMRRQEVAINDVGRIRIIGHGDSMTDLFQVCSSAAVYCL
jgi:hypothetical protein